MSEAQANKAEAALGRLCLLLGFVLLAINLSGQGFVDGYRPHLTERKAWNEKSDCTVVTCANAFGIDYDTAHILMEYAGREHRQGLQLGKMASAYIGLGALPIYAPITATVREFAKMHPEGTYILCVSGHVLCCIDGNVVDHSKKSYRAKLLAVLVVPED